MLFPVKEEMSIKIRSLWLRVIADFKICLAKSPCHGPQQRNIVVEVLKRIITSSISHNDMYMLSCRRDAMCSFFCSSRPMKLLVTLLRDFLIRDQLPIGSPSPTPRAVGPLTPGIWQRNSIAILQTDADCTAEVLAG